MRDEPVFLPQPRRLERRSGASALDAAARQQIGADAEAPAGAVGGAGGAPAVRFGLRLPVLPTAAPAADEAVSFLLLGWGGHIVSFKRPERPAGADGRRPASCPPCPADAVARPVHGRSLRGEEGVRSAKGDRP